MHDLPYFIGCPVWACEHWCGRLFTSQAPRSQWLNQYSRVFNTVEGNSTFYGLPSLDTARRWARDAAPGFRFALKFPREISHDRALVNTHSIDDEFFGILDVLLAANRLGPSFLQLGPNFSGRQFDDLARYLRAIPKEFPVAVEVRHGSWFDGRKYETELDDLLTDLRMDRCLFDARPLFARPPADKYEEESQRRKPRSPYRKTVTGSRPMLRIVGRNLVEKTQPWVDEWAPIVAKWITGGLTPYVFLHAPNDLYAPDLADLFHQALKRELPDLPDLPDRPAAVEESTKQRRLF